MALLVKPTQVSCWNSELAYGKSRNMRGGWPGTVTRKAQLAGAPSPSVAAISKRTHWPAGRSSVSGFPGLQAAVADRELRAGAVGRSAPVAPLELDDRGLLDPQIERVARAARW